MRYFYKKMEDDLNLFFGKWKTALNIKTRQTSSNILTWKTTYNILSWEDNVKYELAKLCLSLVQLCPSLLLFILQKLAVKEGAQRQLVWTVCGS